MATGNFGKAQAARSVPSPLPDPPPLGREGRKDTVLRAAGDGGTALAS